MRQILDFPLNTKRMYSKVTTYNGCELYFPVDTRDVDIANARKVELQTYFDSLAPTILPPRFA